MKQDFISCDIHASWFWELWTLPSRQPSLKVLETRIEPSTFQCEGFLLTDWTNCEWFTWQFFRALYSLPFKRKSIWAAGLKFCFTKQSTEIWTSNLRACVQPSLRQSCFCRTSSLSWTLTLQLSWELWSYSEISLRVPVSGPFRSQRVIHEERGVSSVLSCEPSHFDLNSPQNLEPESESFHSNRV